MGNQQSKTHPNIEIETNHPKLKSLKIINQAKQRRIQVLLGTEQTQYKKWKLNLETAKLDNQFLLLPTNHNFTSKGLCGNSGSLTIDYQNFPYLLTEQIQNRIGKKQQFQQTELWYLLFALVQSQSQMRRFNNYKVGDIRPINIFLNEQGHIKTANLLSWPGQVLNYQKSLQNEVTYLAPQDLSLLKMGQLQNQGNIQSQIFSIGLTILSTATLYDYSSLYSLKFHTFNEQQINKILNAWRVNDTYSDIFKATIASLLEVNVKNRLEEKSIYTWINQYQKNIKARQDFVINDPPAKIINQIQIIRTLYGGANFTSGIKSQFLPIQTSLNNFRLTGQNYRLSSQVKPLFPLQGSRRLVQQRRLPLISSIPGVNPAQSTYTPMISTKTNTNVNANITYISPQKQTTEAEHKSYFNNFMLQGMPMGNTPTYIGRTNLGEQNFGVQTQKKIQQKVESSSNKQQSISSQAKIQVKKQ